MAHRRRDIDIGIGVMHGVKPPQQRHGVLDSDASRNSENRAAGKPRPGLPTVGDRPGRQHHVRGSPRCGPDLRRRTRNQTDEDDIGQPDAEIAEPTLQRRELPLSPRPAQFAERDDDQAAGDYEQRGQAHLPRRPANPGYVARATKSPRATPCRGHSPYTFRRRTHAGGCRRKRRREQRLAIDRDRIIRGDRGNER